MKVDTFAGILMNYRTEKNRANIYLGSQLAL